MQAPALQVDVRTDKRIRRDAATHVATCFAGGRGDKGSGAAKGKTTAAKTKPLVSRKGTKKKRTQPLFQHLGSSSSSTTTGSAGDVIKIVDVTVDVTAGSDEDATSSNVILIGTASGLKRKHPPQTRQASGRTASVIVTSAAVVSTKAVACKPRSQTSDADAGKSNDDDSDESDDESGESDDELPPGEQEYRPQR